MQMRTWILIDDTKKGNSDEIELAGTEVVILASCDGDCLVARARNGKQCSGVKGQPFAMRFSGLRLKG